MNKKTNNDVNFLQLKRDIRIHAIEIAKNKKVLNLFSGENVLWNGIVEDIDNFDIKSYDGKNIKGDAKKVIRSLNLSNYGIISEIKNINEISLQTIKNEGNNYYILCFYWSNYFTYFPF